VKPAKAISLGFAAILGLSVLSGCRGTEAGPAPSVFSIEGDVISIDMNSPMLKYLETAPLEDSHAASRKLAAVGQIIALANDSDELQGSNVSWVELDPEISRSLGFSFGPERKAKIGEAFGVVDIDSAYEKQLRPYEALSISRYGLLKTYASGMVVSILKPLSSSASSEGQPIQVVFEIPQGLDFYPGTNCEVDFPISIGRPVNVASTALLHEGRQEYILKYLGQGHYHPVPVFVLDTVDEQVLVIGNLKPGDRIVSRGAILLKPLLHQVLRQLNHPSPSPGAAS
jgi:hypothetical protein